MLVSLSSYFMGAKVYNDLSLEARKIVNLVILREKCMNILTSERLLLDF